MNRISGCFLYCKGVHGFSPQFRHSSTYLPHFRGKSRMLGKSQDQALNVKQILRKMNERDPKLYSKVNIGLAPPMISRKKEMSARIQRIKENLRNKQLEMKSRTNTLNVDMDEVNDIWHQTIAPRHVFRIAQHYDIYDSLFGDAYFIPFIRLQIHYKLGIGSDVSYTPVYRGNIIKPREANEAPLVEFAADEDSLYTLVLSNPDNHLERGKMEYVHWFAGNIKDGNINTGDMVYDYMKPFPVRGSGYQRLIFILYKQTGHMDYSSLRSNDEESSELDKRTFNTLKFYRERQDDLTPVGLAFYQSDWDSSVTEFFHKFLDMEEPVFEYDFPKPYIRNPTWFAKRKPFNVYLDRFKDPKEISKQVLLDKLKEMDPFKEPEPSLKYPNAHVYHEYANMPSWYQVEMKNKALKWTRRYNENLDIISPK